MKTNYKKDTRIFPFDINPSQAEPRHYRNYQQCLGWSHFFLGNPRTLVTLEPGAHEFEFSYTLPRKIPSSFEGSHGNIRSAMAIYFL